MEMPVQQFDRRALMLGGVSLMAGLASARGAAAGEGAAPGRVAVLHAGSLVNLMEHGLVPAFHVATGGDVLAYAGGSGALANQIKGRLRRGDVFISASPKADEALMGPAAGDWVRWYVVFARSPVVLGYDPQGSFARALRTKPWYEALQAPGLRIGRTDPVLDPKGAFTVQLMEKAERVYKAPGLARRVLGAPDNPAQVREEPNLVGRLQSHEIDVGFFYSTEATDLHLTHLALPESVTVSARYTVAILRDAANPAGAERFVTFLLGPQGQAVMRAHGLDAVPPVAAGDTDALPASIRPLLAPR